jgi:hypothetical protein
MIQNDVELEVTLAQLARMYEAMSALERERARFGDEWFAVMSEGPIEEIHRLEFDLRGYGHVP